MTLPGIENEFFPQHIPHRTNNVSLLHNYNISGGENTQKAYMDLTGKLPYTSSSSNQYFIVLYDYDSNAIVFETIKTRQSKKI